MSKTVLRAIRTIRIGKGDLNAAARKAPAIMAMCITTILEYGCPISFSGLVWAYSPLIKKL